MIRALCLSALLITFSCINIESHMVAGTRYVDMNRFPDTSRMINIKVDDGTVLRGVWNPAARTKAPIVVLFQGIDSHLGESEGQGKPGSAIYRFARSARAFGLSSLVVDYRGVGISDGTPSVDLLAADGMAVWNRALSLAGGDSSRIVLRGISLGTLVVARLLQDGARPACALLHCPVRVETALDNAVRHSGFRLLTPLVKSYCNVDIIELLKSTEIPTLIYLPQSDPFVSDLDRKLFESTGKDQIRVGIPHVEAAMVATASLLPEELRFLDENGVKTAPWYYAAEEVLALETGTFRTSIYNHFSARNISHKAAQEWLGWMNNLDFPRHSEQHDGLALVHASLDYRELTCIAMTEYFCVHCFYRTLHRLSGTFRFGSYCVDRHDSLYEQIPFTPDTACFIFASSSRAGNNLTYDDDVPVNHVAVLVTHMLMWASGIITRISDVGPEYLENNEWKRFSIPADVLSPTCECIERYRSLKKGN